MNEKQKRPGMHLFHTQRISTDLVFWVALLAKVIIYLSS
jgi:hypothetical protein